MIKFWVPETLARHVVSLLAFVFENEHQGTNVSLVRSFTHWTGLQHSSKSLFIVLWVWHSIVLARSACCGINGFMASSFHGIAIALWIGRT